MLVNRGCARALAVIAGLALSPAHPSRAATETQSPPSGAANAAAAASGDEQARDLFRARRYPEALVVYQRLRAETRHPTYLRNIGRCHQMMHQPAPAIAAFEAYLREAPNLGTVERAEVQDYIAEMRRMELTPSPATPVASPATAVASPATAIGPAPTPGAAPAAPADAQSTPPAMVAPTSSALLTAPSSAPSAPVVEDDETSVFRRWWFWAGVGALVVATGIVVGVAASGEDRLPCPGGAVCP